MQSFNQSLAELVKKRMITEEDAHGEHDLPRGDLKLMLKGMVRSGGTSSIPKDRPSATTCARTRRRGRTRRSRAASRVATGAGPDRAPGRRRRDAVGAHAGSDTADGTAGDAGRSASGAARSGHAAGRSAAVRPRGRTENRRSTAVFDFQEVSERADR